MKSSTQITEVSTESEQLSMNVPEKNNSNYLTQRKPYEQFGAVVLQKNYHEQKGWFASLGTVIVTHTFESEEHLNDYLETTNIALVISLASSVALQINTIEQTPEVQI